MTPAYDYVPGLIAIYLVHNITHVTQTLKLTGLTVIDEETCGANCATGAIHRVRVICPLVYGASSPYISLGISRLRLASTPECVVDGNVKYHYPVITPTAEVRRE